MPLIKSKSKGDLKAEHAELLRACKAAWRHIDTYGYIAGHKDLMDSQANALDLLWNAVVRAGESPHPPGSP